MNGDSYSRDPGWYGSSSRGIYSSRPDREERRDRDPHRDRDRDRERIRERDGGRDRDRYAERRRSRSPGLRAGRPPRRDYEADTYSSSRDYREREREDRYSGRDRRGGDRGWERDRGFPRRDPRRDDDDRYMRRERDRDPRRDVHRDRDGAEDHLRGHRRDRDGPAMADRGRKRTASPQPAKRKEPTPDLTDVIPVLERKRRMTQWDIKPPGYENVTAEQAKLSGMFPLPGAPRQQAMDPSRLQAFMSQPAGSVNNAALKPSNSRQAKRLFVHNLTSDVTEDALAQFFNLHLNGLNIVEAADPCISAGLSGMHDFAMLEFKSPTDATLALALDGISMDENEPNDVGNGVSNGRNYGLAIRRPKDYIAPTAIDDPNYQEGVVSTVVPETQSKICVSNIPMYLTDEQVTELLQSFGELKSFVLVKDRGTEESRGIAFCEYLDPAATDIAIEGLNGMELGDKLLRVRRASIGMKQAAGLEMGVNAMSMLAGTTSQDMEGGRVLQLLNMVTPEELLDNDEYEEICQDITEECEKFGEVLEMKVPRPSSGSRQAAGIGKIFVKFADNESAGVALRTLAGRKFADRTVVTTYFSEENFDVNAW